MSNQRKFPFTVRGTASILYARNSYLFLFLTDGLLLKLIYKQLSDKVLQAAFTVHSSVGSGLLESVYQKALEVEIEFLKIPFASQVPLRVLHRNKLVGDYYADIIVDGKIILELKAVKSINSVAEAQLLNYLSISCLLYP